MYGQFDPTHLKAHFSLGNNIEKWLERETLNAEIDSSLAHLYPIGENGIILIDFICQLRDIGISLLSYFFRIIALHQSIYLMNHAVDKWSDAIDQRKLGTQFQVATPIV